MASAQVAAPSVLPANPSPLGFSTKLQAEESSRSVNRPESCDSAVTVGLKCGMYVK